MSFVTIYKKPPIKREQLKAVVMVVQFITPRNRALCQNVNR